MRGSLGLGLEGSGIEGLGSIRHCRGPLAQNFRKGGTWVLKVLK